MTTKLFIGNLSFDTTDEALKELFSQAGNVKTANIVKNKFSGRSRGFGFIEMETDAEATKAIELLNNKEVEGRQISVSEARPREEFAPGERREGGGDRGGSRGGYSGGSRGDRGGSRGGYSGGERRERRY